MVYVKCLVCGKSVAKSAIKAHERAHSKEKRCLQCGETVPGWKKFCGRSCAAKFNKNRAGTGKPAASCRNCGTPVSARRKYCNNQCQGQHKASLLVERWLQGEVDGNQRGKERLSAAIESFLKKESGHKCARCGWCEIHPVSGDVPLSIHHIDGNPRNSKRDNLIVLCPNCHSLTPNYGNRNKGHGRSER